MHLSSPNYSWALAFCLSILGCQPNIGDSCTTNADCSLTGDRLCDITSKNGYCTQFNCLPGKCPDEAACVGYYTRLASECMTRVPDQRFERTFCMKKCESSSDCRTSEGYDCLDPRQATGVSAVVLEAGEAASTKVCMEHTVAPAPASSGKPPGSTSEGPPICVAPGVSVPDAGAPKPDAAAPGDGSPPKDVGAPDAGSADGAKVDASRDAGRDASGDAGRDASGDARIAP